MASVRQRVRTLALQALYEADLSGHPASGAADRLLAESRLGQPGRHLMLHLMEVLQEHREEIDGIIQEAAPMWPLGQVAPVDRNLLRVAVAELCFPRADAAPVKAVINEAVDLAKQFGSEGSSRFVNGVLGTISGQLTAVSERR